MSDSSVSRPPVSSARSGADEDVDQRLTLLTVERDRAVADLASSSADFQRRLAERTLERDALARSDASIELLRTNAELKERLAARTIERDEVARDDALTELARTNAELKRRLAQRTIERDDVARDDAGIELARSNAELKRQLAERTLERDDIARDDALTEVARTNAELKRRLAERTIERDDVAREDALTELARTNADLQQRLGERTVERDEIAREKALIELARTDLVEEQHRLHAIELEALNGELESFSYSVSHDLRSPVRAILGYTRSIEEDYGAGLDDECRRLLAVVVSEAARMGDLIDDLLAFSQLGRQSMVDVPVDMMTMAREIAADQARAAGKPVAIFDVSELPAVRGDRALLRQVWVNLLSNAVKYSSKREQPQLKVWSTQDEGRAIFHVQDDGVGFDMAYASKLFGVFQRLHRSDEFPGTGVGLAIVQRIVQRHGGTVWADAKLGAGGHVLVRLAGERTKVSDYDDVEILLVEDNSHDAAMTIRALKKNNFANKLYWVKDGVDALDFVRCKAAFASRNPAQLPKLILLDLKMPRLDGIDVLRALKEDERTRQIPVVAMTSSDQDRDLTETYRLGVNGYVTKPVQFASFVEIVAQLGMYWLCVNQGPVTPA